MIHLTYTKRRKYTVTTHETTSESTPIIQGRIECEISRSRINKFLIHVADGEIDSPKVDLFTLSLSLEEVKQLYKDIGELIPKLEQIESKTK